jgi:hypothetical protein
MKSLQALGFNELISILQVGQEPAEVVREDGRQDQSRGDAQGVLQGTML